MLDGANDPGPLTPTIQVIGRCEEILRLFSPTRTTLRPSDLEVELGMQRSTAHRYLASMAASGFLDRMEDGSFGPGPLLVQVGTIALDSRRVLDLADPYLRRLSDAVKETCVLSLWGGHGPVVARVVEDLEKVVHVLVRIGATLDITSAQGRVFLAFLHDPSTVARVASRLEPERARELIDGLEQVRQDALAINATVVRGVRTIAAPILDRHGKIAAAMAVVGTMQTIPEDPQSGTVLALRETAGDLSRQLGWAPESVDWDAEELRK